MKKHPFVALCLLVALYSCGQSAQQLGKYVTKDLVQSYCWFLIYNECKRKHWHSQQENSIKAIREVEKLLSSTEKEQAKSNAEAILNRSLNEFQNLHSITF